jgi:hypothetical protein
MHTPTPKFRSSEALAPVHDKLEATSGFTVCATRCANCLFGKDRLVRSTDAGRIIQQNRAAETFFVCHEFVDYHAESDDRFKNGLGRYHPTQVCCRAYYDTVGADSRQIRMAHALDIVRFVDQNGNVIDDPNPSIKVNQLVDLAEMAKE